MLSKLEAMQSLLEIKLGAMSENLLVVVLKVMGRVIPRWLVSLCTPQSLHLSHLLLSACQALLQGTVHSICQENVHMAYLAEQEAHVQIDTQKGACPS